MTMIPEYELSGDQMRQVIHQTVQTYLSIEATGYRCNIEMLVDVLLKASSEGSSVEAVCNDLEDVADSNTIRETLNKEFEVGDLWEQEAQMNQALASHIPSNMPRKGLEVAMDFHDEPFYGKSPELRSYTVRTQAQKGTTHFLPDCECLHYLGTSSPYLSSDLCVART